MNKPASIEDIYPLSPLQAGMLFHTLLEPGSGVYFEQLTCELHGRLDEDAFARTWQLLAARHTILRTAFVWKGQREPVQVVHRQMELPWRREDWREVDPSLHQEKLEAFLAEDRLRGFELNRAPLMRIATVRLADDSWQLISSHHHILLDGWSFPLLLREFGEAYRAFSEGRTPALSPVRPFSAYLDWLQRRDPARTEAFWRAELSGFSAPTPLTNERGTKSSNQYRDMAVVLQADETALLQASAKDLRVTLNTVVQGAYALVLSRYSSLEDVVFGVTMAGRPADLDGVENMIGLFINTVPLRLQVSAHATAAGWLAEIQERQLAIQEFGHAGLADIQRWSGVGSGQPLFHSLLVFENYPIDESLPRKLGSLEPRNVRFHERTNYPLTIIAVPGDVLALRASFDPARIDADAVERTLRHVVQAMLGLAKADARLGAIEITTPAERQALLAQPERPAMRALPAQSLHAWFSAQAEQTPDAVAISDGENSLSYADLDASSNRIARRLQALGVHAFDRVGLLLERGSSLIAGLLGILKAGATYVPLDPVYPDDRIAYMVEDSGMKAVVTQASMRHRIPATGVVALEISADPAEGAKEDTAPIDVEVTPEYPAYIIYTSGSTGRPKGCPITHANVLRLFTSTEAWFGFNSSDVWTLFHSVAFDFSVWEIWGALLYGGRLVVVPYYTSREPEAFYKLAVRERVTVLNQTPSAFRQFMQAEAAQPLLAALSLRYIVFGGEALNLPALRPWFVRHGDAKPRLVNMYGITETTVHVTWRPLTAADAAEGNGSLIGCPLPDLQMVALDTCGHLAPIGIPGELYVGGAGLSKGYIDRPELTTQRFVPDPFGLSPDGRLYRTGDQARRLANGDFEYLGRVDHQVKIRGFRVELGEIESELSSHAEVRAVAVVARDLEAGESRLVAYLVARAGVRPTSDDLRAHLRQRLPEYMVPANFVWLERLPLTPHGKVDRAALPEVTVSASDPSSEHIAPRNDREAALAQIWQEVLGVPVVGIRDNYFALGGDSIRSLAIRSRARDKGIEFSLQDLFEKQTVESLASTSPSDAAQSASEAGIAQPFSLISAASRKALPADVEDAYPLTQLQLGMLFHSHERAGSSQYLDTFSFHLRGPFDGAALQTAVDGLIERHAVLRTSFDLTAMPEPLQLVHKSIALKIHWLDISALSGSAQERALDELISEEAGKAFDWTSAPLLRAIVHRRGDDTFQFTFTAHHAILDGWSVASLLTEAFQDYLRLLGQDGRAPMALTSPTFSDFVALERADAADPKAREFWAKSLADAPVLALPSPLETTHSRESRYVNLSVDLPAEVGAGLMQLAERLAIPVKSLLLAAHVRVLGFVGAEQDVVTGLVSNGRPEAAGAERLAGLFLNTLPFRMRLPAGTWAQAASAVFHSEMLMLPYRRVPLAEIQKIAGSGTLFHTDFNFVNFHVFDSLRGMDAVQFLDARSSEETNFALAVNFSLDANGTPRGVISADLNAIDPRVASALPGLFQSALTAMALSPDSPWRETVLTSAADLHRISASWKETAAQRIEDPLLHELVEAQADRTPDAIAVMDAKSSLSYHDLNAQANQLAHWLIDQGVRHGDAVGMAIERSTDMVVALLGILKAGAAYVPIDPTHPAQRIALTIRDSGARLILADRTSSDHAGFIAISDIRDAVASAIDTPPLAWIWPESPAYVLYTSGSTGVPKGVVVPHMAVSNHMEWMQREFPLSTNDVVLQKTPVGFDASVWEFWATLSSGAKLVMAVPGGHQDPIYLAEAVRQFGVTTLQLVPSVLDFFLEHATGANCPSLRRVFAGGEALRRATRDRFYRTFRADLINLYGPTEATIDATFQVCTREGEIGIGHPISNMSAYILDDNLDPVPPGVPGELYLAGAGLALGYQGLCGMTADRFMPDPWAPWPGMRMYRTGDRARLHADGSIFFTGRVDDQIKINGNRVEPGEIEAVLASAPGVERALVVAGTREGNQRCLIAYVVPRGDVPADVEKLFTHLRGRVPSSVVPAHIVVLDQMPIGPNGKVDRRSLPSPGSGSLHRRAALVAPSTPVETQLADMWKSVLGVPAVGIHDNFFELGGDSIQSLRLVSIAAHAGWRLRPKQIFDHPTIAELSMLIERHGDGAERNANAVEVDSGNIPLLPVQREFLSLAAPNPHHWNQAVLVETSADISVEVAERAWKAVTARHAAFRLRFTHERAGWRQYLVPDADCQFATADLQQIAEAAAEAHAKIDVTRGPLACSVLFPGSNALPGRWLFVAHHLCMDGVSWRILLEELALAITSDSGSVSPLEEVSFPEWAVRLEKESGSEETKAEAAHWSALTAGPIANLPLDFPEGRTLNLEESTGSVNWGLDEAETAYLVRELPRAYRCTVEELLLAALAASLQEWTGSEDDLLVDVEGHGREEAGDGGDLSHTVGWFTSVYPIRLKAAEQDTWARLRSVKEMLRDTPRGGLGYGLLRYFGDKLAFDNQADISFNYLGRIDLALSSESPFRPAAESTGADRDPQTPRARLIDVVAMVTGGRLQIQWLHSKSAHRAETMEAVARRFGKELRQLLAGVTDDNALALIPSDFPLADLDRSALVQLLEASAPVADIWPLTPLQEGILVHALHDGDEGLYGQQVVVDLTGSLKVDALRDAWMELARRHEMLRVEFRWQDLPGPRQMVQREIPIELNVVDWSMYSAELQEYRWDDWLAADRARGFNLSCVPLWRVTAIQLGSDQWRLVWSHHHLLLDGWSLPVVFRQLLEAYAEACGTASVRPHSPQRTVNYRDYLVWLTSRDSSAAAAFWKKYLAGYQPPARLEVGSKPSAANQTAIRASVERELSENATRTLREFAQSLQITTGACIQAIWGLVLALWNKQSDFVFGLVVSGRPPELPGIDSAVGMFINTLPLRVRVPRDQSVAEWLRELHRDSAQLRQFEYSRLVDIQSWSEIPRGHSLFEALLIVENYPMDELLGTPVAGITFGKVETREQTNLPLNLYAVPGKTLELRVEYDTASFLRGPMESLVDSVAWLLESMPSFGTSPVRTLNLLRPAVAESMIRSSAQAMRVLDPSPVHRRVSAVAAAQPERTAVSSLNGSLTYGELEASSNQLAHHLQASGAGQGTLVGIYLDRSPDMLVALLGVLKSGAAYVPMDPGFPPERLAMMVADSGLRLVVTTSNFGDDIARFLGSTPQVRLDADRAVINACSAAPLSHEVDPREVAYVIFTSGSTGRPKGVQVTHGALSNFLNHFAESPGLVADDVLLAVTTLSFDIAGLELFLPLVCGAQVAICPRDVAADARGLAAALEKSKATVMQATPATWRLLLTANWRPAGPMRAWCGGEALPADLAAALLDLGLPLWNLYGPTETTIWSTTQQVTKRSDAALIGQPISNTLVYILDGDMQLVPDGMAGQLFLGGDGLAQGYIGRPDLTAERFVPDPFGTAGRLYATGDFVRRGPDGNLEFLGRGDHQVKVRGFRIELEDIEIALRSLPGVAAAAAAVHPDHRGEPRIVAYVVGLGAAGGAASLRTLLRGRLPDYMLPSGFVDLATLPLTPNGKLDRKALANPGQADMASPDFVPARNALEQVLADLWRELLGLSQAGARDHFFELGGHSLLAAQALARISKYFQVDLSLRTFFSTATPETVAQALIAIEPKPGQMVKIATALLKIRSMSQEQRANYRERGTSISALG